jgi:hypothetical protein
MVGAPPQMDLFDYKPQMMNWYDKDLPESIAPMRPAPLRTGKRV